MAAICMIFLLLLWQTPPMDGEETSEQILAKILLDMIELQVSLEMAPNTGVGPLTTVFGSLLGVI